MEVLVLRWLTLLLGYILAVAINYQALRMADDRRSRPRTLGVISGTCGVACLTLLPFMVVITVLQWSVGDTMSGFYIVRAAIAAGALGTAGSLAAILWASWLERREARQP